MVDMEIVENRGLYCIEHFNTEAGQGMGMYDFGIALDGAVVKHLLQTVRAPGAPMLRMLDERLRKSLYKYRDPTIRFFEKTWMLTGMTVGAQCACFGVDGGFHPEKASKRDVRYISHNIDSVQQSSAILSA
jgi:hypothetical protein